MDRLRRGETRAELSPPHAHLVGQKGHAMLGLAQLLVQGGVRVTGPEPAAGRSWHRGARVDGAHCPPRTQLLIHGPEIGRTHPSRLRAARRGIVQSTVGGWLDCLMRESLGLAVVGQRAAACASAMVGWTLTRAGLDPTVVLASRVPQLDGWARAGAGPHLVADTIAEAGQLAPCGPRVALLLDIAAGGGPEHVARLEAIRRFVESVPADGHVLGLRPNAMVEQAVRDSEAPVEWVSLERGSSWWGGDLREDRGCYRFRAFHHDRFAVEVRLRVPGRRNVLSALAAVAACARLAVPTGDIKQGLEEFSGVSRDFESRGSYRGVTLVDDAGSDPASVLEALEIARRVFGRRQLWAVYSRAGEEAIDGAEAAGLRAAFAAADHVLVDQGRRAGPDDGASQAGSEDDGEGGSLVGILSAAGIQARGVASLDEAIRLLDRNLEPGDVLVTLGAGDVGTIADAFIRRLSRDRQGR